MTMNQTVTPEVLRKLPPDFFDLEQDNLSEAESALRQGYRELSGHVAKLSSELEGCSDLRGVRKIESARTY
jgi:hypothetical protein